MFSLAPPNESDTMPYVIIIGSGKQNVIKLGNNISKFISVGHFMKDFIEIVENLLEEKGMLVNCLFEDNIISENTFYKYRKRYPNLNTLIKIANYLEVSIDYLFEMTEENNFSKYEVANDSFYKNLKSLIDNSKISGRKFCNDLNYSRDNLIRWKNGTQPSVRTLIEIANYFHCSIDELLK